MGRRGTIKYLSVFREVNILYLVYQIIKNYLNVTLLEDINSIINNQEDFVGSLSGSEQTPAPTPAPVPEPIPKIEIKPIEFKLTEEDILDILQSINIKLRNINNSLSSEERFVKIHNDTLQYSLTASPTPSPADKPTLTSQTVVPDSQQENSVERGRQSETMKPDNVINYYRDMIFKIFDNNED